VNLQSRIEHGLEKVNEEHVHARDSGTGALVINGPDAYVPKKAMVVVAHPDDAEFMAAGTVAKWSRAGCTVTYVIVTRGDKGSDDADMTPSQLAQIREEEQRTAGKILGVSDFVFMGYPDGYLQHTLELRRDLTRVIRTYCPEVLICFDPTNRFLSDNYVNHPDHRASGDATIDAVFPSARDRLTFPELMADGLEPHKVAQLWLGASAQPNTFVDIGDTLDLKFNALRAHPSQLGEEVIEFARELARWEAEGQDFEFGESFRRIVLETD
jgi:LmbE family N-acetylglucosaminyl deacetylase